MIAGQDSAVEQFRRAMDSGALHHAWLLAGPKGVGKAHFARAAAVRLLADGAGPKVDAPGLDTPADHPIAKLIEAGSHPDMRWLQRLVNEKTGVLARNISVDQVRTLGEFMGLTPALSDWRVVVIDSVDNLEPGAANALLKMLEEPPPKTVFLLVSHSPGRLLPTIRSRCRRVDFHPLDDDAMTSVLATIMAEISKEKRRALVPLSDGSVGKAAAYASLDLAELQSGALAILERGDPDNSKRSALASQLARKTAADRYAAFLDLVPALIAREARTLDPAGRERALLAYAKARELAAIAPRLSLDPAATVFQLGGILASVAEQPLP
ncbi:DNA polymerase III subunit delta' [Sphingomonas sabuli]|uniref:DNA polymerase III subunit delta n=1 Tax=Sphingomonas sabuli TaxID=2764186 RepID=A0A7G9L3K1_9SPHN|nr:DNA polymerase III subunit delta' [Sphingomonas sabuli]QNM83200.1 DNA polymerase III subunit delta' [Sphingomonas sabuli]